MTFDRGARAVPIVAPDGASAASIVWRRRGQLHVTAIVKKTFALVPGGVMKPVQPEAIAVDELGDAATLRSAGDLVPFRPRVDVVFTGHAFVPRGTTRIVPLRFSVLRGETAVVDKILELRVPEQAHARSVLLHGVGPLSRHWPVRKNLLGDHDPRLFEGTALDLPAIFDEAYFQAAPVDQRTSALAGDEWLWIEGVQRSGVPLASQLPSLRVVAALHGTAGVEPPAGPVPLALDTVHVDLDALVCNLVWRGSIEASSERDLAGRQVIASIEEPAPAEAAAAEVDPVSLEIVDEISLSDIEDLDPESVEAFEEPLLATPHHASSSQGSPRPASSVPAPPETQRLPPVAQMKLHPLETTVNLEPEPPGGGPAHDTAPPAPPGHDVWTWHRASSEPTAVLDLARLSQRRDSSVPAPVAGSSDSGGSTREDRTQTYEVKPAPRVDLGQTLPPDAVLPVTVGPSFLSRTTPARAAAIEPSPAAPPEPARLFVPEPPSAAPPEPARLFVPEPPSAVPPEPARLFVPEPSSAAPPEPARLFVPEPSPVIAPEPPAAPVITPGPAEEIAPEAEQAGPSDSDFPAPIAGQTAAPYANFEVEIFEEHAEQAGFLWTLRDSASDDPRYRLEELFRLDERVVAHLDALRQADGTGWQVARSALEPPMAESVFVAGVLSVERADATGFGHVLAMADRAPHVRDGLVAALGWVSFEAIASLLQGLLGRDQPASRHYVAIAALADHRMDPGRSLASLLSSPDARLRARALLATGELGRADLRSAVRDAMVDQDEACRFAAGVSGVLLGEPESTRALGDITGAGGPFAEAACAMAVRRTSIAAARTWLSGLANHPLTQRAAVCGAGALGDVELVPWLLETMRDPALARLAAAAFSTITGADMGMEKLAGSPPEGFSSGPTDDPDDDDVAMDPDASLTWPNVEAVRAWWMKRRGSFEAGRRHILGKPLAHEWLEEVLRTGHQQVRAAAAVELCLAGRRRLLVPVKARADRQRRALWS